MNREELWDAIRRQKPELMDGKGMTPRGVRKFFDLVWDTCEKNKTGKIDDVPDFLKGLFNGCQKRT